MGAGEIKAFRENGETVVEGRVVLPVARMSGQEAVEVQSQIK